MYSRFYLIPCRHLTITGPFLIPTVGTDSSQPPNMSGSFSMGRGREKSGAVRLGKEKRELLLPRASRAFAAQVIRSPGKLTED